jgi:hypothetical protein
MALPIKFDYASYQDTYPARPQEERRTNHKTDMQRDAWDEHWLHQNRNEFDV